MRAFGHLGSLAARRSVGALPARREFSQLATRAAERASSSPWLLAGAAGAAAAAATVIGGYRGPLSADSGDASFEELQRKVGLLEVTEAEGLHSAFLFIKPHAVTEGVKGLVTERLAAEGISIVSEGAISAERIDKNLLIDTHYGAIAARAMRQKPTELVVQQGAQDGFRKAFGLSWTEALEKGQVYNLVDGAAKLGISMDELGKRYDGLTKGVDMLKFGGGFYCGKLDGIYVINGFYAKMRSQFTVPNTCIYYYEVQWNADSLSWGDFRGKVLGGTDPKTAEPYSLRNTVFNSWKELNLDAEPNTGNNGVHASASPFEALAERANWLGVPLEADYFGRAMLSLGISSATLRQWCDDPAVSFEGKKQSLFDLLEDLDAKECLKKSAEINKANE